jgi:hypothetical protein
MGTFESHGVHDGFAGRIAEKLRSELKECPVNFVEVESVGEKVLMIRVGTRISSDASERIATVIDDYCAKHSLSEAECAKRYREALERCFKAFNEMYSIGIDGEISLPRVTVTFTSKEAEGDGDWAGMLAEARINTEALKYADAEEVAEQIAKLVAAVYRLT